MESPKTSYTITPGSLSKGNVRHGAPSCAKEAAVLDGVFSSQSWKTSYTITPGSLSMRDGSRIYTFRIRVPTNPAKRPLEFWRSKHILIPDARLRLA